MPPSNASSSSAKGRPASSSSTPTPAAWPSAPPCSRPTTRPTRTDPESAFGGIIAVNRELDAATAQAICDRQFVEVIIAPQVSAEAVRHRRRQEERAPARMRRSGRPQPAPAPRLQAGQRRHAGAGCRPCSSTPTSRWSASAQPTEQEMQDLLFAWRVAKFVKSNAIVYGKDGHDRRRRRRADEPGQLGAHRRHQGRACRPRGQGGGHGLRRLLPLP